MIKTTSLRRITCDQCVMLSINGLPCHELGCPNAWQGQRRKCKWCGSAFIPTDRHQICCDAECVESFLS